MEPVIHPRRTVYAGVALLLITLSLPSRICNPLDNSNVSDLYTAKTNLNFTKCESTTCSTTAPSLHSKLDEAISAIDNYFSNDSSLNQTKADTKLDVKSSEFAILHNIIQGIIDRFTETTSESSNIDESVDLMSNGTFEENGLTTIPPALFRNLKSLVPPFLSELFGRLTETFDEDLPETDNETTSTESVGILESFRQTVLGMAEDKPADDGLERRTSDTNMSSSDLKKELNEIMNQLKQRVENPAVKESKIDQLCEVFAEHITTRIQSFNDTISSTKNNRIVSALQRTSKVVCSEGNKRLLRKLANSQSIWANRITRKVLGRAIDRISKRKTMLRFVLNMIMGTIVDPPRRF
uniref:Uncharacterized protein n=1 Tax=Lygus hesperus TaxID=30085 RepID=A0A0K8SUH6_LYGHE